MISDVVLFQSLLIFDLLLWFIIISNVAIKLAKVEKLGLHHLEF